MAPVAIQQGRYLARRIRSRVDSDAEFRDVAPFRYRDKGQMATIGRRCAVIETWGFEFAGWPAWFTWLLVHIYFLVGFKNRIFVVLQWAWAYLRFHRGARLIVGTASASRLPNTLRRDSVESKASVDRKFKRSFCVWKDLLCHVAATLGTDWRP